MKKFFAVLLAAVMILGCVSALAEGEKIALVTDVGTIDDESFNQACWQAVEAFAIENDVEYSRDIEPEDGRNGDTYYKWLCRYIADYRAGKKCPKLTNG